MLSGQEDQRVCRTNDIRFISKSYCAWGSKWNFDLEIDLDEDAVGRSRYEWFCSVRSSYAREAKPSKTFVKVLKELSHVFKQSGKLRRLTRELKFMIIPVELMYFVMLCNAFRERTWKHESKRKSNESSARRFNNFSLRKTYKLTECQK